MLFTHVSVMAREVIDFLRPEPRKRYLDGTLGGGGHTEQILIHSSPNGHVIGLDLDDEALAAAAILSEIGWQSVDGIVLDLGISSHQLESRERGFSFRGEAKLDMRMDRGQALDAYQIVNAFSVSELERILRKYGEEPQ